MFINILGFIVTEVDNSFKFEHEVTNINDKGDTVILDGIIKDRMSTNKEIEELSNFSRLEEKDLESKEMFVIYVYYDRNNFNCTNCKYFRTFLEEIKMNMKFINFGSDVFLGSKFDSYIFPAFILRNNKKTYKFKNINTGEQLLKIINGLSENELTIENLMKEGYLMQFKSILEPGTKTNTFICYCNVIIFKCIDVAYFIMKFIPEWLFHTFIFLIVGYLIYSIVAVIREDKKKEE